MADRRYAKTHEWLAVEGKSATVGITDFAQAQLGDVVFLDLPSPGRKVAPGESFGVIESVKAANDLYSPAGGTVTAVNEKLAAHPELVNTDPLGEGWILKLELSGAVPDDLMDEAAYKAMSEAAENQ
jgi:glycine cleavage system H protein